MKSSIFLIELKEIPIKISSLTQRQNMLIKVLYDDYVFSEQRGQLLHTRLTFLVYCGLYTHIVKCFLFSYFVKYLKEWYEITSQNLHDLMGTGICP